MSLPESRPWSLHLLLAGLMILFAFAWGYRAAPDNDFHFDDRDSIGERVSVRIDRLTIGNVLHAGEDAFLARRPIPSMTFAIDWWRGGGDPAPFIWTNLVLHGLAGAVVFALLALLLVGNGPPAVGTVWIAALATAAWLLHPIQVQAVTYIVQRMATMAALFTLLSVLAYVVARTRARAPWPWWLLCAASFAVAALSKENAWLTPLLWLLAEYGLCRRDGPVLRSGLDRGVVVTVALGLLWMVADLLVDGPVTSYFRGGYGGRDFTLEERLLTQPRVIGFHLGQILFPWPGRFSLEHDFAVSRSLIDPPVTLLAWLLVVGWCLAGVRLLFSNRGRVAGFCLLWVPATLAVESSIVPLELVFEHRMYLPSFGLAGLLALGLQAAWRRRGAWQSVATSVAVAFLGICLWATQSRVPEWQSTRILFESALRHAPTSARLWGNLSSHYGEEGDWARAERAARRALELQPGMRVARETLAVLLLEQGRYAEAERALAALIDGGGVRHPTYNHYGEALFAQGRFTAAAVQFARAIQVAPWTATYYWNLALAHERLGRCDTAFGAWRANLRLEIDEAERERVREHLAERYDAVDGPCARPSGWPRD